MRLHSLHDYTFFLISRIQSNAPYFAGNYLMVRARRTSGGMALRKFVSSFLILSPIKPRIVSKALGGILRKLVK